MTQQADVRAKLQAMRRDAPRFDQAKDGNPFYWIIQQAEAERTRQRNAAMQPRARLDYLSGKPIK